MANKRSAAYVATLVYLDEPQLLLLRAYKTNVVALAIPSPEDKALFIATTVSQADWSQYMDGNVDLRYLFTYSTVRTIYQFDLMKMSDNKVVMIPWEGKIPEEYLPSPRFFSRSHTEEDLVEAAPAADVETLVVDGEWDMPDFGSFYSRYSDVYYFLSTTHSFRDSNTPVERKSKIKQAFKDTPFRGGFSYVHLYSALAANRSRNNILSIDKIKYESPGYVNINGDHETFIETRDLIKNFLSNRAAIKDLYARFYAYLSKGRFLQMPGERYPLDDATAPFIDATATQLAELMRLPSIEALRSLVDSNPLVFAKIVMSIYRRLDETSRFFAQGRMNFS